MNHLIFTVLLSVCSLFASAQTFYVLALNESDGSPIKAAEVIVLQDQNGDTLRFITDINGLAPIEVALERPIRFYVKKDSVTSLEKSVTVSAAWLEQNSYVTCMLPWQQSNAQATKPETAEDILSLDSLPPTYRILEARPVREQKVKKGGFNVITKEDKPKEYVDVNQVVDNQSKRYKASQPTQLDAEEEGSSVFRDSKIYYKTGKVLLGRRVKEELDTAAEMLKTDKSLVLNILCYADADGEATQGDYIAQMRADVITQYLMQREVSFSQLRVVVRGNLYLENGCDGQSDCSAAQHAENRRVDLYFEQQ